MTYRACKRSIELAKQRGTMTEAWKNDMMTKLDIFLINNRITDEEYLDLVNMMKTQESENDAASA